MQVVPHLVVEPSIEWTRQDGTVLNASSGYSLQLNFNPLQMSDSDHYTCCVTVAIISIVSLSEKRSRELLLNGEMIYICYENATCDCTLQYITIRFAS